MSRLNPVCLAFLIIAVLALSGCDAGGGYAPKPWAYSNASQSAEQPPGELGAYGPQQTPQTAPAATQAEESLPPVKVALLLPLSGPQAGLGEALLNAAQIALFDVGYGGFELVPADTRGTPDGAREAVQSVTKQGAELILGPVFAEEVKAVKPVAASARINVIAFSTDWSLAGGNTYIMGFLPFDQIERVVTYAAQHNHNRIGVLAPQSEYGRAVVAAYRTIAARVGADSSAIMTFPPSMANNLGQVVANFTKYEDRMKAAQNAGPPVVLPYDTVLMPVGGDTAMTISNLMSQNGLPPSTVKRLGTGLFDDPALAVENSMDGAWFAAPSPRLRQNFEQRYLTTYATRPPRLATLAYDATALAAALARRGYHESGKPGFDSASIHNPNGFAGVDGIFRFRADGTAERGLAVLEFKNGSMRILEDAPKTFQQPPSQ